MTLEPGARTNRTRLGRIGIWSIELRFGDRGESAAAAAELEDLGYSALWIPGGRGGDVTGDVDHLLDATERATIGTGILNIWMHDPKGIAEWWHGCTEDRRRRVMLGLGVSHSAIVGEAYAKPISTMSAYLEQLDEAGVPPDALCLAALGPKMLRLARDRTSGVHPYLVTAEHSAIAREALGPDRFVAPEVGVILETDPARAREIARQALSPYRQHVNYVNSWKRLGFSDEEIEDGADRLIDALFAWGGVERIAAQVNEHFQAGADHVCIQAITGGELDMAAARTVWRELAAALL